MGDVIAVDHLTKAYGHTVAVDDVSFSVAEGEIFGILGPNGAGKTTTVECLQGLRYSDGGALRVLGLDLAEQLYEKTLAIQRHEPDTHPGNLANAVRAFAVLKDKAGKSDEGRPLWEEARGLYARLGVAEGVAECDERLR